jgi:hypothetical protein
MVPAHLAQIHASRPNLLVLQDKALFDSSNRHKDTCTNIFINFGELTPSILLGNLLIFLALNPNLSFQLSSCNSCNNYVRVPHPQSYSSSCLPVSAVPFIVGLELPQITPKSYSGMPRALSPKNANLQVTCRPNMIS